MAPIAFPAFLDLAGRRCLVIGGGAEAERKAALLRRAGADVHRRTDFSDDLLAGMTLVIVAEAPLAVAEAVARAARAGGILVNVVDRPALCDFIVPAIVDRAPVVVAISTAGTAPGLAKLLRMILDRLLPRRLGELAALAGGFRPQVSRRLEDAAARRRFWRRIFTGRVAALALAGRPASVALRAALDGTAAAPPSRARDGLTRAAAAPSDQQPR
jgi:uroporphyrin-III C-methyltransferase / precorrin-2 dehydrogenase / sirohydrochlorin ferrochelatase